MTEGKVLTAAQAMGFDSLAQVAKVLVEKRPELFIGIAPRSLGAKLSDLNRGNVTWWRTRAEQREALGELLALETGELVMAEQARRRGLWVFNEFPELPALNLLIESPTAIADPVRASNEADSHEDLFDWMRIGTGSEHEQPPLSRLGWGVRWLTVPKGTGRSLMLGQFQARNRIDVFAGGTLPDLVSRVHPLRPAVLAPEGVTQQSDLSALAQLNPQQPVLVISTHPLPRRASDARMRTHLPSWEWLSASPLERDQSQLAGDDSRMIGSVLERDRLIEFVLQLKPEWRSLLLQWIEDRLSRHPDSLFSAKGLTAWLDAFDPNEVLFATPASVMSLARICHGIGERKLPKPAHPDAGMNLIKQLSGTDSRYRSLLTRLVARQWLDAGVDIQQGRSWDEWLTPPLPASRTSTPHASSRRNASAAPSHSEPKDVLQLTSFDLDAAANANLLVPNGDGNYEIRSQAEAMLALRDLLRSWLQSGDVTRWAPMVVGDEKRQEVTDQLLATIDDGSLIEMCRQVIQQPIWSLASLGASETLFIAIGLRMAAGTLGYQPEFGELLAQTLARCITDDAYISLPLSRSTRADRQRNEWIHASWGWSLVAPRPKWVPESMTEAFPGWMRREVNWLKLLSPPDAASPPLRDADVRRLAATVNTAVKVLQITGSLPEDSMIPAALKAVVEILHATRNGGEFNTAWWQAVAMPHWSRQVLAASFADLSSSIRQRLAASMLEACVMMSPGSLDLYALVHSRVWVQLLDTVDPVALCDDLSTHAIAFLANNVAVIPSQLRQAVFDKLDPRSLRPDFDWETLLGAVCPPSDAWLDRALNDLPFSWYSLATALWARHPQICLDKAIDPNYPYHCLLRDCCIPEWTAPLGMAMAQAATPADDPNGIALWAATRIASSGKHAQVLIDLLSSVAPRQR